MNASEKQSVPTSVLPTFRDSWKADLLSGFLVFLIALPLCLAISLASGYPAIAGIFTAVVGGVTGFFISSSALAIKGPAAGLIVIALGAMNAFGYTAGGNPAADQQAYRMVLAVGVAAGCIQILFALFRTGVLGEFFPTAAVHGMLAAIGVIIISKQIPIAVGLSSKGEPLELLAKIPDNIIHMNPEIAVIGIVSLLILFGLPLLKSLYKATWFQKVPAQLIVILVAIPLALFFDLDHRHSYTFPLTDSKFEVGPQFLVFVPEMFKAITFPDFSALAQPHAWTWVAMFALIGTLESMLSSKAVDLIDPWHRKTNLDRDNLAIGIGNTVAAMIGGLPMISEIVRSRANIDNGARTKLANLFHGMFLLIIVASLPALIHRIPLSALAAMLIYTGFRLASPKEFLMVYKVGKEQFAIFMTTLIAVLATDLLIGIAIGIGLKFAIHIYHGVPLRSLFRPNLVVNERDDDSYEVTVHHAAIFSNWIAIKRKIDSLSSAHLIVLDLSNTRLVDHTVMEKLHEMEADFHIQGRELIVTGLEDHQPSSDHPLASRTKKKSQLVKV
ncbi:MAG: SulP family inorganic anion transporter [Planctomycetota bacterium]|nr:SulP family inorganic anion transporter [Planctomycetota bacterium]